jgi:hypothetical protein
MDRFQNLLESAYRAMRADLRARLSTDDTDRILPLISELSLPGLLTLLASGQRARQVSPSQDHAVDLSRDGIAKALAGLVEKQGVPVTPDQAEELTRLLLSGQLCDDVASGAAVVLHTGPRLPGRLSADLTRIPELIPALVVGIARDLRDSPHLIVGVVGDLKDGQLDTNHHVMVHTLRALFQLGTAESLVNLLRTLIGPEYETFRLAIIIYAASQGIHVDADDLDRVRATLNPENPDLGPLLQSAFEQLVSTYPEAKAAQRVLRRLARQPAGES